MFYLKILVYRGDRPGSVGIQYTRREEQTSIENLAMLPLSCAWLILATTLGECKRFFLTWETKGVIIAPMRAIELAVPNPIARICVGYTLNKTSQKCPAIWGRWGVTKWMENDVFTIWEQNDIFALWRNIQILSNYYKPQCESDNKNVIKKFIAFR